MLAASLFSQPATAEQKWKLYLLTGQNFCSQGLTQQEAAVLLRGSQSPIAQDPSSAPDSLTQKGSQTPKGAGKAKVAVPATLEPGTILYTSGGYEQTNVRFYKVVKMGKLFFEAIRLDSELTATSAMTGTAKPTETPIGDKVRGSWKRKVSQNAQKTYESIKIQGEFAHRWDGTPQYYSSYH